MQRTTMESKALCKLEGLLRIFSLDKIISISRGLSWKIEIDSHHQKSCGLVSSCDLVF